MLPTTRGWEPLGRTHGSSGRARQEAYWTSSEPLSRSKKPVRVESSSWGHSQGGQAALFTGEIAQDWTPELELKGVIAAAPTSQLAENIEYVTNTHYHGFVVMLASAYDAVY